MIYSSRNPHGFIVRLLVTGTHIKSGRFREQVISRPPCKSKKISKNQDFHHYHLFDPSPLPEAIISP